MNNKNIAKIAIWTSIAALAIGVAAIIIACPRKEEPGFDYTGAIVGVLSLLVTCLVGYEVFRAFTFDKRVEKEVSKKLKNAEYSASCLALAQLGNALYGTGQHALALQSLFNALIVGEMAKMSELGKEAVENSIALLEKISDELRDVEVIRLESAPELVNRMKSAAFKKRRLVRHEETTSMRILLIGILLQNGFNDARAAPHKMDGLFLVLVIVIPCSISARKIVDNENDSESESDSVQ